jgi:hypothetical protein
MAQLPPGTPGTPSAPAAAPEIALHMNLPETDRGLVYDLSTVPTGARC